jgi:hypothetical protein
MVITLGKWIVIDKNRRMWNEISIHINHQFGDNTYSLIGIKPKLLKDLHIFLKRN